MVKEEVYKYNFNYFFIIFLLKKKKIKGTHMLLKIIRKDWERWT